MDDIPSPTHRNPHGGLPSMATMPAIRVTDGPVPARGPFGFGASNRTSFSTLPPTTLSSSIPMSIPNARSIVEAPPPLPPPRYPPVDGGPVADHPIPYREPSFRHDSPMSAGSGYFGSMNGSLNDRMKREVRWSRPERDEGYGSMSSTRSSQNSMPFGVSHEKFQFRPNAYDSAQLKKLDSLGSHRSLNNRSPPHLPSLGSSSGADSLGRLPSSVSDERRQMLKPLSLPTRTKHQTSMLDSPSRYTETPARSALSPRSTPFGGVDSVPGSGSLDFERSPISRPSRADSGSVADDATVSTASSGHEMDVDEPTDFPMEDSTTTRLRGFHIDDQARCEFQHAAGLKRRASSPLGGDEAYGSGSSSSGGVPPSFDEGFRRRDAGASRGSPTPRLSSIPQGASVPSAPTSACRIGSFVSNLSRAAGSLTMSSPFSHGRQSPGAVGGLSPSAGGISPTEPSSAGSPFGTPMNTSPRSSISSRTPHIRTLSDQNRQQQQQQQQPQPQPLVSPRKLSDLSKGGGVSKLQGMFFMCECCPKKPKKFDSQEALSVHEAEKQYECSFCGNRFKNKNEAERHQNSLHVRRHSWSCSALSGWSRAFHESTNQPGRMDTCGYCGKEFIRSGAPPPRAAAAVGSAAGGAAATAWTVTDQDWEERIRHLTDAHKFRECNSSKKFYRADHFRQHLKHSHAGTSGKWTNMLENACMLEEDPPVMMGSR